MRVRTQHGKCNNKKLFSKLKYEKFNYSIKR